MKRIISILCLMFLSSVISAQILIDENRPSAEISETSASIYAAKELFAYSGNIIYTRVINDNALKISASYKLYDSVERTSLPDTTQPISASNIPYISSIENYGSYNVGVLYIRSFSDIKFSIGEMLTFLPLNGNYMFSTGIISGILYKSSGVRFSVDMFNLFSTTSYVSGVAMQNSPIELQMSAIFDIIDTENGVLRAGLKTSFSYGYFTSLRYISGKYSFDRSMVFEYQNKSFIAGLELLGIDFQGYTKYRINDRVSITAKYSRIADNNRIMTGITVGI